MGSNSNSVPKDLLPEVFEFTLQQSVLRRLDVKWLTELQVLESDYGNVAIHTKVSTDRWHAFWEALNHLNVWNWQPDYHNSIVLDNHATVWSLKIKYHGKLLESGGFNAFPSENIPDLEPDEQFEFFVFAVNMLAGTDHLTSGNE